MSETKPINAQEFVISFFDSLPHCCGYPNCDGDLVGMNHSEKCQLYKKTEPPLRDKVVLCAKAYASYVSAEKDERIAELEKRIAYVTAQQEKAWEWKARAEAAEAKVKELEAALREEIKNYCIHCAKGVPMSTEPDLQDRVHNLASPGDPDYRVCKSAPFKRVLAILERKGESQ